jgi:hypothetical protein
MKVLGLLVLIALVAVAIDVALHLQGGSALILGGLAVYFLPSMVGFSQHKRNAGAILILNLLLGWTLIGWIVALVWACTHDASPVAA